MRRRNSMVMARAGWSTGPIRRTCRPSPAARRSCCTFCRRARSSSPRRPERDTGALPARDRRCQGGSAMPGPSSSDQRVSPPRIEIPRHYNAAHDLIDRNLGAGRADKTAYIDDTASITYGDLARRVNRFANALGSLGIEPEQRILVCMLDTIDWPVVFLGAIKAGVIPVAANTLLTTTDYEYM